MKSSSLKILGVIGDPISHSLSPIMHNAALAHLGLPYLYMPFHVTSKDLDSFFTSLKKREIHGLNVTIPHKQAVIPFMDSLTREARLIGAVNTIIFRGKKRIGHNTDGRGFLASLEQESNYNVKNKHALVLGAGGASRAIGMALGLANAREVILINRTLKTAFDLSLELGKKFPKTIYRASPLDPLDDAYWKTADLLINTSSMGMKDSAMAELPLKQLPPQALVVDIVYTPLDTALLKKAKKLGLKTHQGWGMLLHQGMLSFEKWTGKKAPYEIMKKALLNSL